MIWKKVTIRAITLGAKDRLGNAKKVYGEKKDIMARITQWTAEDVNLYGRDLTKTTRKLLTPNKTISKNTIVTINGQNYEVIKIMDLDRFKLAFIERYNYEIQD